MRFVLVAGEASGDRLGAALISALKTRFFEAEFVGGAAPRWKQPVLMLGLDSMRFCEWVR